MLDVKFIYLIFILYCILFYFILFMKPHVSMDVIGAEVIYVTSYLFVYFEFWDGKQNFVPNVWQVVLANISIQGRAADSYIWPL